MRKYLLIIITLILMAIFFLILFAGLQIGKIRLYSYKEIDSIAKERLNLLSVLDEKNNSEYEKNQKSLQTTIQNYRKVKAEYDQLVQDGKITANSIYNSVDLFDANVLEEEIKKSAIENEVTLNLNTFQSQTSTSISFEYVMCDLRFNVSGEYTSIINFINSIEKNEKFNFEISNFSMTEENEILRASFLVKDVPISSKSLSK